MLEQLIDPATAGRPRGFFLFVFSPLLAKRGIRGGGAYGPAAPSLCDGSGPARGGGQRSPADGLSHPLRAGCSALIRRQDDARNPLTRRASRPWSAGARRGPSEETGSAAHVLQRTRDRRTPAPVSKPCRRAGHGPGRRGRGGAETDHAGRPLVRPSLRPCFWGAPASDARRHAGRRASPSHATCCATVSGSPGPWPVWLPGATLPVNT